VLAVPWMLDKAFQPGARFDEHDRVVRCEGVASVVVRRLP
jgi:hypothetical protein